MTAPTTPVKRRYYSPSVQVDAEVCLSEFSTQQLEKELEHRGASDSDDQDSDCGSEDGLRISATSLTRIETLLICGQRDSAIEMIGEILEPAIGRRL